MTIPARAGDGTLLIGARTQSGVEFSQVHSHILPFTAVSTGVDDSPYAQNELVGTTPFQWSSIVSSAGDQGIIRAAQISIDSAPAQAPAFELQLFTDTIGAQTNHAITAAVITVAQARTQFGKIDFPVGDFVVSNAACWCTVPDLYIPFTPNATELFGYLRVPNGAATFTLSGASSAGTIIRFDIEQA